MELQTDLHALWLDASHDRWYVGGGAYDNRYFGYSGRPSFGHSYLGTVADCQLTWKIDEHVSAQIYYGHMFGADVIGAIYPAGREGDFGYAQIAFAL